MSSHEQQGRWVLDGCHDEIQRGDIVIHPEGRFEVLDGTGTGMFQVRRPDGSVSPMRPSTILAGAARIERIELVVQGVGAGLKGYER